MSAARQHGGQQDAADVSEQDRKAIRQGAARLGDGSRRAQRGGSGGNARQRSARAISGGNAQGPTEPVGEASDREALAEGEGGRRGQIAGPGRRALCLRPERRSRRQGTRDAAAAVEMAVGPARQARRHEREARRDADENGRGALEGADRMASGRSRARQGERRADLLPQSPETANRQATGGALSAAHESDRQGSGRLMAILRSTRRRGGSLQEPERGPGDPPDLPSRRKPNRSPYLHRLAYALQVTLTRRLHALAPGLTARSALEKFAAVQMIDVHLPTTDGREIVLTRYTQPEPELQLLINQLRLTLPAQPPPKITAAALAKPTPRSEDLLV